ncbi:lipase 3 [Solenopsis invicta]|uniref:lipase 3 n=1 Tax=Solenopsis invicta TaxID=13686 RepID=UPI00193E4612|nr:lipase 3 [Solenopsis invicta]XP_025987781.2 lipase 3 [Solenopsis invicta]XP_025987782.2 lipase 3 [Solenopsis invicta]XP_039314384.1 lipase 3 [Solenopsis invicta]XP_039314385.1 lipase 3 [Solenopsis invicta]
MTTNMKSILFALIIIMTFSEGKSQFWQDMSFLQDELLNLLFPKDPALIRVRRMDRTERMTINAKVLDFIGLVEQYDYPAEEHNVTTDDGYNLIIHRIPGSPLLKNQTKKGIVFFQHGIVASSDIWVLYGPKKDLAFLLADQGYDVWLGNMRGNSYCRSHVNMTIYDRKFWQYSFHEVGTKDLPALFDYIFKYTGQKDLYYIGHSMGTTSLFALLSTKPEYNVKIKMAICLAPVAFWNEVSPTFTEVVNTLPIVKEVLEKHEIYDAFPQSLTTVTTARILCNDNAITQSICITVLFLIVGADPAQLNTTSLPDLISHCPAGTSIQAFEHYYQNIKTNDFQNYDYGIAENYKRYKQKTPPSYDLKKITAPIVMFYGANDVVVREQNVRELSKRLSNVLIEEVPYKLFNHVDFTWAIDAKSLLYDRILELIQKFDTNQTISMQ